VGTSTWDKSVKNVDACQQSNSLYYMTPDSPGIKRSGEDQWMGIVTEGRVHFVSKEEYGSVKSKLHTNLKYESIDQIITRYDDETHEILYVAAENVSEDDVPSNLRDPIIRNQCE